MDRPPRRCQRTTIDDTHIHAKGLAREIRDIRHVIAVVAEADNPVEDRSPDTDPCCESRIDGRVVPLDDVVNRVVEKSDQTRDSNNGEWLAREETEYHGS